MSTQTPAILESMAKIQEELDAIKKDQKGFGYKFRGIDQVLNAMNPLFKKHKVVTLRRNLQSVRNVRAVQSKDGKVKDFVEVEMKADYVFKSLVDGSEIVSEGFGEGQDTSGGDKASSMATSNSYKYVIFEMFNIATEEQKDSDQVAAEISGKTSFSKETPVIAEVSAEKEATPARRGRATQVEETKPQPSEATEPVEEKSSRSFRRTK